ncbi:MAG: hypothetical protein HYV14_09960 [Elusimicrobia bacterium]|nr:hypothetical protein [Elusimicrobiota bacterium]
MTRQFTVVLGLGFALAAALGGPALAQQPKEAGASEKCLGGASGDKCGGAAAAQEHDLRVVFDKEGAKGEIKCKKGKLKDGKVEFEKCLQDKLDKYEDVAVLKKIVAKEQLAKLPAKKKRLAKKLAFYDSARKELKGKLAEMGEAKKEDIEYKKAEGALEKIDKEFDKSLAECAKEDKADFACPTKD